MELSTIYTPELFQFVQDHLQEDPAQLLLKHRSSEKFDLKEAVAQIAARQKGQRKLPEWAANDAVIFPPAVSLEQCSSAQTAAFKQQIASGKSLVDLTGGFGVDAYYLGQHFEEVVYVERQEKLSAIAKHNFSVLPNAGSKYRVHCADAITFLNTLEDKVDWMYLDPARRGGGNQKLYQLADCEPNVVSHWDVLAMKSRHILIKASPMLDIKEAMRELPELNEVHVVAVKNEVKELLLVWKEEGKGKMQVFAWSLPSPVPFCFDFDEEAGAVAAFGLPEKYLILPSAAILKAGAFKAFGKHYGLQKLHPHTHLYTSSKNPAQKHFQGRVFEIIEEVRVDKKTIKKQFPTGKVNVISRNHPMKPDALKKKFRLRDGGEDYLIMCTVSDGSPKAYHCRRN